MSSTVTEEKSVVNESPESARAFCPSCGAQRITALQYCMGCGLDFEAPFEVPATRSGGVGFAAVGGARSPVDESPSSGRSVGLGKVLVTLVAVVAIMAAVAMFANTIGKSQGRLGAAIDGINPTTEASSDSSGYNDFTTHVLGFTKEFIKSTVALTADSSAGDYAAAAADAETLNRNLEDEETWLAGHPPAACYRAVWDAWSNAVSNNRFGAAAAARWMSDFPNGTNSDLRISTDSFASGASYSKTAAALVASTDCGT